MRKFYAFLLLCPLFFGRCEKSTVESDEIAITFTYPLKDYEIANESVTLYLYALPEFLADAPAFLVFEGLLSVKELPYTVVIPLEQLNEEGYIQKFNESFKGAKFYLATDWDSDNNGTANCSGDLFIDYNDHFPYVEIGKPNTVYLISLSNGDCGQ